MRPISRGFFFGVALAVTAGGVATDGTGGGVGVEREADNPDAFGFGLGPGAAVGFADAEGSGTTSAAADRAVVGVAAEATEAPTDEDAE